MKKRLSIFLILALMLTFCACKPDGPSADESAASSVPSENSSEQDVPDVWQTVSAETVAEKTYGFLFGLHENFTDIAYRWNEKRQIAEMTFRADDILWTARAARLMKFENIAGEPFALAPTKNETLTDSWLYHILGTESIVLKNDVFDCCAGAWYWKEGGFMFTLSYFADEYQPMDYAKTVFNLNYGLPETAGVPAPEENNCPRIDIDFRLDAVFEHLCPSEGDVRMMVVPVSFTDGYEYTEEYFEKVRQKLDGIYPANGDRRSVREYFLSASYGKLRIGYEIFPVVEVGKTAAETEASWQKAGEYARFYQSIFETAKASRGGDLSDFDLDRDGAADLVLFIFNDPAVDTDAGIGSLFGSKSISKFDFAGTADDTDYYIAMCIEYGAMTDDCPSSMKNDLIHEIGHTLGLEDYYSFSANHGSPSGGFDMQCYNVGDWSAFSKLAVGWIDPFVVDPDTESVTLRLGASALYPDALLIPTGKGLNGSIFDEYMLVDVLAWTGNNRMDWFDWMVYDPYDPGLTGGVRITHVDARLVRRYWNGKDFAYVLMDDFGSVPHDWDTAYEYLHLMSPGYETAYGLPEEDPYSYMFHVMEQSGSRHILDYGGRLYTSDLFRTGSVFSMDSHAAAFSGAPYMNNGSAMNYEIRIDSYDPEEMTATVTVRRIE